MAKNSGLVQRNGWYYFRRRIPTDISALIKSDFSVWKSLAVNPGARLFDWRSIATKKHIKKEWLQSLKTENRREANILFHQRAAELEEVFQIIRAAYSGYTRSPTDQDLKRLAGNYFCNLDEESGQGYSDLGLLATEGREAIEIAIEDYVAANPQDPVYAAHLQSRAKALLTDHEFGADLKNVNRLAAYLYRAEKLSLNRDIERAQGNFSDLPSDELFTGHTRSEKTLNRPSQVESKSLAEAYQLYREAAEEESTHPKTMRKFDYIWRLLKDVFGPEFAIRNLDREQARLFADTVKALPASWTKDKDLGKLTALEAAEKARALGLTPCNINTANGYIARFSTFLKFSENEDLIDKNVASGLVKKPRRSKLNRSRRSFTVDELQRIFTRDYRDIAQLNGRAVSREKVTGIPRDPRYWAPLISLFTGMRLHEICQLTKHEVRSVDGIWCIRITWFLGDDLDDELEEGQVFRSMKTAAAERVIPVMRQLVDLGFIDFVNSIEGHPNQRIFPQLEPDKDGYLAAPVSRWFARHLDYIGVTSRTKVFHSFRHTFRDALRKAKVDRDVVLSIGAWSSSETSDHYGEGSSVRDALSELDRVRYDGLDLSHLHHK